VRQAVATATAISMPTWSASPVSRTATRAVLRDGHAAQRSSGPWVSTTRQAQAVGRRLMAGCKTESMKLFLISHAW
jgi:hypothetical protein